MHRWTKRFTKKDMKHQGGYGHFKHTSWKIEEYFKPYEEKRVKL